MTINPQHHGHDQFDVLQGSVSNHFAQIESVLLQNECVNGQYQLNTAGSYAQNCPIDHPGFTTVCISTNGAIVADLENSYITAELEYTLKCNKDLSTAKLYQNNLTKYFIGFKQSLDALTRYDIYVNSQMLYSQPYVGAESFVQVAGLKDEVRNKNPYVYTSYRNASRLDQNVCGVYVDMANIGTNEFKVKIPVKINIHQFLMLSSIHYLPSFAGRWEIRLYFGPDNLVVCPVDPTAYAHPCLHDIIRTNTSTYDVNKEGEKFVGFSKRFTQIGDTFYAITGSKVGETSFGDTKIEAATVFNPTVKFTYEEATFNALKCSCQECFMNTTQFQLRYEVYQALMSHYIETPLIIPTNVLSYYRFTHQTNNEGTIHAIANLNAENVDSMYVLIPESPVQTTCFYQPYLTQVRMSLGEFGIRPAQYVNTFNDPRFVGMTLDALNLESSQIAAMNKDFANSINPHPTVYANADGNAINTYQHQTYNKALDDSHFMIGIPLSQVGFQSGTVSSPNTNINFQFSATREKKMDMTNFDGSVAVITEKKEWSAPVNVLMLMDSEIMIQVVPNSDNPVVRLSSKSIV